MKIETRTNKKGSKYYYVKKEGFAGKLFGGKRKKKEIKDFYTGFTEGKWKTWKDYNPKKEIKIKTKPIMEGIETGKSTYKLRNIENSNIDIITDKRKEMLSHLVKDEELLNILTEEPNMEKMKHRIECQFDFKDRDGEIIERWGKIGVTDLKQIEEIKEGLKIDRSLEYTGKLIPYLKFMNFIFLVKGRSESKETEECDVTVIFRKGEGGQ